MRTASQEAEHTDGGGGGEDRDGDGRIVKWGGYCSKNNLGERV